MTGPAFVRIALCLGLVATAFAPAADALACGGEEVMPAIDYRVMGVAQAERALRDGHVVAAAGSVIRMFPDIRRITYDKDPLLNRASRILAMASVRGDGALKKIEAELPSELLGTWRGASAQDQRENLDWSIAALRRLNAHRANDPALQSDLGEALSKVDAHRDEALKLLGGLADKDLLASPDAYAALARLRGATGDAAGRDAAEKRCEAMAQNAAVCRVSRSTGPQS